MPFEKYEDGKIIAYMARASQSWKCFVCGNECLPEATVIRRRDGKHRHEQCGGPPRPDKPPVKTNTIPERPEGGTSCQGNEQGRVIRKADGMS